jgi:glycosyl transferase family 25
MSVIETLLSLKIDKAYCISIKEHKQKQLNVLNECNKINQQFDFLLVDKNYEDPTFGCLTSHLKCIKNAKENNYKNILIMEDDVIFDLNVIELVKKTYTFNLPSNYEMIQLGYNLNAGYRYDIGIIKLLSAQAAHCYILNESVFDFILDTIMDDWTKYSQWNNHYELEKLVNFNTRAIDLFYAKFIHSRKNSYGIYPIIAHQRPGMSDIENKQVNYNELMIKKSISFYRSYNVNFKTFVLNLDRREDRWKSFLQSSQQVLTGVERISAVDGKIFDFQPFLNLFNISSYGKKKKIKNPYGHHNFKKGILGCSLSHYLMWKHISSSDKLNDDDFILILEDDIVYSDNFIRKLNNGLEYLVTDKNWDITYLGYTDYKNTNDKKVNDMLIEFSSEKRLHGGGTFAYFIRKRGALKMLKCADKYGIQQAIDWFMIEQYDEVVCYKFEPELIFSKVATTQNDDSDVQTNDDRLLYLDLDLEQVRVNNELLYLAKQSNMLFRYDEYNNAIDFYGKINGTSINLDKMNPHQIKLNISRNKHSILVYVGKNKFSLKHKLFCERLKKENPQYEVYCFTDTYSVIINGIKYMPNDKINVVLSVLKKYKMFLFDITYAMENKIPPYTYLYIDETSFYNKYENIVLKENGKYTYQNLIHNFENIFTFSQLLKEDIELLYGLELKNLKVINYNLDNIQPREKRMQMISYDKSIENVIILYKLLKQYIPTLELVLYSNEININGAKCYKRQNIEDRYDLETSKFFVTCDTTNEFEILNAMKAECLCIIPNYYYTFKNKAIMFDEINDDFVKNIASIINNNTVISHIINNATEYIRNYQ